VLVDLVPSIGVFRQSLTIFVWLGVVANDCGVDEESQKLILIVCRVVLEKSSGV